MTNRTLCVLAALAANLTFAGMTSSPAAAQSGTLDRLSVHGFLTQAYGITDGHQYLGLTSNGTADYRVAALQFRYDDGDRDAFVIQLSHERIGRSPMGASEPAVALDWVFYEHRFGDHTVGRVGKIRTPTGIYNEIRDVGVLLPLYRPPTVLYGEQMYTSETVDGVMLGHRLPLGDWTVEVSGFAGGWEYLQIDFTTVAKVDKGYGGWIWVETPVQGVRAGGGAIAYTARNIQSADPDARDHQSMWLAALDGSFLRGFARAEYFRLSFGGDGLTHVGNAAGYHGEVGIELIPGWSVIGHAEFADLDIDVTSPIPFSVHDNVDRDLGLGIRYQPSPTLAFKLEGHAYRGFRIEDERRIVGFDDLANTTYALFSVSTSF
jgi:hypothetical protein